jgi:hypothetical protein
VFCSGEGGQAWGGYDYCNSLRMPLLDRVYEQLAQAHTAGSLADRETAEYPGGLCFPARVGVRWGADDDKPSRPGWNPVEQGGKVVRRQVEFVVFEFFRHGLVVDEDW